MRIFNKMKKTMLVMMASLFCANVAFAEVKTGSYAVVADDIASGAQITSVEGITMTFGTSETWTSGSGKVTVDGTAFNVYASTSENCSPTDGAIPTAGPYVVFTPQFNGTVTSIVSNAGNNKKGYIVKDEDNNLVNGTVLIDGAEVAWESGTPYNSAAKYNGGVTFEVEAGSTYYFYMAGSKMRFNGFIYTYEEVEAEPETPATEEVLLTDDMFKAWDGVGADAQVTGAANCESHIGEEVGAGAMVYGTSTVYYLSYADLSAYSKMVIEGTPGVQLRVMLNRLVDEGTVADGNLTEVNVTIGEDGKATVDFSAYEFVHLNAIKTGWGSAAGTITKIALVKADPSDAPAEGEVMLSTGIFKAWDGVGADAQATGAANCELHIGESLGAGAMVYGTSTVYYLSYADLSAYSKMVIEGTPGVQLRVMINRLVDEGTVADGKLTEINVTIAEDGKAEIDFSAYEFVHLNAIKTGWGSAAGTISKIYLVEAAGISFAKYEKAVADAEAFKATLNAEDVIEADIIMVMDEAIAGAAQWLEELKAEGEYLQEDVDMIADDLNANTAKWNAYINMKKAEAAAQEVLMRYPEESRVDNAGLIDALRNLPLMVMWETAESLQAHADGVNTACAAFEKENNQLILDAAKKKAADYAATLDASEETGTMAQMEAYGTLTYYTSDDFFTESGISADNYEMVMSYSQQIDMMIAQYDPMIQQDKKKSAAKVAVVEAQNTMALYEGATDEAGLTDAIAKVNEILNELNMWDTMYTLEDLNAAVSALAAARVEFVKENGLQTGTYWLKNVASGKFITAGESWGTCAVFGDHGMDFDFALQEDGTFIIDSKLSNGGASHYFGAEGWMDAASTKWSLEKLPNGAYTITANGTGYLGYDAANVWNAQTKVTVNMTDNTAETAQWKVLSKEDMVASLEGASLENPADATFFISCPNFGRNDTRFPTAWQGGPARNGANDNMNAERWNANFDVYQDLNGLPNGLYKVSVQGYYRAGNGGATSMEQNAYLYANENTTPLVNINSEAGNVVFEGGNVSDVADMGIVPNNQPTASTGFTAGLYADNTVDVWVNDGTLRIGVKKDVLIQYDWTCFDNFELTYYGSKLPSVTSEVVNVLGKHRLVALASDCIVPTEIFYSFDEAMTEPAIYTAPFYVSETTTVYAYAQFIDEETRERFTSDVVAIEIEAGAEVALNAPVVEQVGKSIVITSDQSDVLNAPADTIEYAVYKKNAESGAYETAPYVSGIYVGALAIDWISGDYKVVAKSVAFGYATAESAALEVEVRTVAYLCGAETTTEAIYTALVNSGLYVTPLNYDGVTLTDAAVDELAAEYDLVVLAGNTGSGTNLAKSANLLVGKVNVLSTKSFWYKHYGTNGSNPGTADTPSRSLTKTVADHPIFEGIEGDEFEVFNDMAKETGRYLQGNGSFNDAVGLTQTALAQTNGTDCIGEGWLNGFGYVIVPVDGVQPAGWLTADGEALFVNIANYLIAGEQYAGSGSVTDNPFGIDVTTTEEIQWPADIYDIKGRMVKKEATSLEGLQSGLYLIKGQKVLVK